MSSVLTHESEFNGSRRSFSSDDSSSLCSVDLGLGFGLKPGGLPRCENDSISNELEVLDLFQADTEDTTQSEETLEKYQHRSKPFTWRTSLQESVEQLKEIKGGLSRISKWSLKNLPKRSFSLKLRNRTNSESAPNDVDKGCKGKACGLRRINSARGLLFWIMMFTIIRTLKLILLLKRNL